jgi:uncharacterized protein YjbI with pentapeptide repeats
MIYLLGVLHRNGLLEDSVFQMPDRQVKFEIYDRICRWLLGEPATGSSPLPELVREGLGHASRTTEAIANLLQGHQPQELRQQMQVAALRILQTGGHKATLGEVEAENSSPQKSLRTENSSQFDLSNLPAFFFKIQTKLRNQNYLEFSHPKLGEYLCAEEIAAQLKSLTEKSSDRYGEISFTINSPVSLAEHIYGLLGYGLMSVDMEEMVIERLREEQARNPATFPFSALFGRLYGFYQAYCRGRWLDEGIAHQVHSQLQALNNPLNTLQIDAAVGLNVFLLLSAIAREAQMPFSPCGHPNVQQEFDADQLLTFIGRTAVLSPTIFWQRSRHSLSQLQLAGVCLNRAMLAEANLWQVNLSGAELIGTNLAAANLQQANLSWANLTGADLSGANLTGARLEGANLTGANLHRVNLRLANLSKACVFQAQMDVESQKIARDNDAIFSLEEFQSYSENLAHTSHNITDNSISGTDQTLLLIESAEGEPILHEDVDDEGGFEPTIILDTFGKPRPSSSPNDSDGYGDKETAML